MLLNRGHQSGNKPLQDVTGFKVTILTLSLCTRPVSHIGVSAFVYICVYTCVLKLHVWMRWRVCVWDAQIYITRANSKCWYNCIVIYYSKSSRDRSQTIMQCFIAWRRGISQPVVADLASYIIITKCPDVYLSVCL